MRDQIISKMVDRIDAKDDIIEQKIAKVEEVQELSLPCVLTRAELKEQYIFGSIFEGNWAKDIII